MQQKTGRFWNIVFFIVMLVFFVYFGYRAVSLGFEPDVFAVADNSDTYSDVMWIGLVVSLVGGILTYLNIKRESTFLRGINTGIVIGVVILAIVGGILAPN